MKKPERKRKEGSACLPSLVAQDKLVQSPIDHPQLLTEFGYSPKTEINGDYASETFPVLEHLLCAECSTDRLHFIDSCDPHSGSMACTVISSTISQSKTLIHGAIIFHSQ